MIMKKYNFNPEANSFFTPQHIKFSWHGRNKPRAIPAFRHALCAAALHAAFSLPVLAADFTFDKANTGLIQCKKGDGNPSEAWTMTRYDGPMSGVSFDFLTEGVEFSNDRRMTGIFFHRVHGASIENSNFNVVIDGNNPINGTFFGIGLNASDNLNLTGNSLTVSTQNNDPTQQEAHIKGSGKQLHLIHIEGSTALTEWVETRPGHSTQITVDPARGSNDAHIADNHMSIKNFVSDVTVATVSAIYTGGEISENTLTIENSSVKRIDGVSASAQTQTGGESQTLSILDNVIRVSDTTFNELRGAYLSGAKNGDRLEGNRLYLTNPTISAKWSASEVIAQRLASVSSKSDRNQPYQDVVNGYLEVTGVFTADSAAGDNQSFEFGAGYSSASGVRGNHVLFKDLTSKVSENMIQWKTYGGYSEKGDAVQNSVTFDNAQFDGGKTIYGGVARDGSAELNTVSITNGSRISGIIIGAYATEEAVNSSVTVTDSTVSGTLAVFNGKNASTTHGSGTLEIKGDSDVSQAALLPYMTSSRRRHGSFTL